MQKRSLADLTATSEPAWPLVLEWISAASVPVEILPPAASAGQSLESLQVTVRSPMGAIVLNSGGLLIDHGWLRVLGSGHPRLTRKLPDWSFDCGLEPADTPPPWLLVADDVLGGFFALNGGRFGSDRGGLWYFAPDSLMWEDLGIGYSQFLVNMLSGKLETYYTDLRWPGWEAEVGAVHGDRVLSVYPFLSTAGPSIAQRSRRAIPVTEAFSLFVGAI